MNGDDGYGSERVGLCAGCVSTWKGLLGLNAIKYRLKYAQLKRVVSDTELCLERGLDEEKGDAFLDPETQGTEIQTLGEEDL